MRWEKLCCQVRSARWFKEVSFTQTRITGTDAIALSCKNLALVFFYCERSEEMSSVAQVLLSDMCLHTKENKQLSTACWFILTT
uniref:Uncharacterized protein n=1 Tax=Arundo donax TaxID=35708 RepID=A0A0A9FVS8_ARUDO